MVDFVIYLVACEVLFYGQPKPGSCQSNVWGLYVHTSATCRPQRVGDYYGGEEDVEMWELTSGTSS